MSRRYRLVLRVLVLPLMCRRCNARISASPCPYCGSDYMKREGA